MNESQKIPGEKIALIEEYSDKPEKSIISSSSISTFPDTRISFISKSVFWDNNIDNNKII